MMVGFVGFVWERPETAAELAKNPPKQSDLMFDRLDINGDGLLTADEIPDRFKPIMLATGVKIPEKGMSREEFEKLFDEMRKRFAPARPQPGQGGSSDKKPDEKEKPEKP
jgi:hypothetical protein